MKNSLDVCKDNIIMSISLEDKSWTFCILSNTLVSTYPYLTTSAETNVLKPSPIKLTKLTLGFPKRNLIHGPPRTKETAYKALVRTQNTVHLCGIHIQLKTQTWLRWSKGELEKSHFRGTEAFCYEFLLLKYRNNTFL